ncbi:MAG: hypothetical protein ACPLSO_01895 [Fervidicoccaceae archaeon]
MREVSYFTLAYNGKKYHGFQIQPGIETIEGCVLSALADASCFDEFSKITYSHGGRTDRGVSAIGQIISLSLPEKCFPERAMKVIEDKCNDVYVWGYRDSLPPDFKIRYWALWREYIYIDKKKNYRSQLEELKKVVNQVLSLKTLSPFYRNFKLDRFGKYYFSRVILKIELKEFDDFLILIVRAQSFPFHFVRRLISFLRNYESELSFQDNLNGWPGGEAEAENLILMRVMTNYYHKQTYTLEKIMEMIISSMFSSSSELLLNLFDFLSLAWDP